MSRTIDRGSCKDSEMTAKFKWDFGIDVKKEHTYYSPAFALNNCNYSFITVWQLSSNLQHGILNVSLVSLNEFPVEAKFQFLIFVNDGLEEERERDTQFRMRKFESNDQQPETVSYPILGPDDVNYYRDYYEKNNYIYISIRCTIFAYVSDFQSVLLPNFVVKKRMQSSKKMVCDNTLSDVTFDINGKELTAHKAILATHSEVFQKMFLENCQEFTDKKVKIETIEYEVFKELLYFIYTGEFSVSEKTILGIIEDLLIAADQYFINDLKDLCEVIMCNNLNVENGLKYLELADRYNANVLKSEAIQFIVEHSDNFFETLEFKTLAESNGKLSFKIMYAFKKFKKDTK